jgi:hypothetical protein
MMQTRACLGLGILPRRSVTSHTALMRQDELDSCKHLPLLWRASVLVSCLASMCSVRDQSQTVLRRVNGCDNGGLNHACTQDQRTRDRHDLLRMRRQKANQARLARIQALQPRLLRQQLAGLCLCAHACMQCVQFIRVGLLLHTRSDA